MSDDPFVDLGRRLRALVKAYQMGISFEYTLKRYGQGEVEQFWVDLARQLLSVRETTTTTPNENPPKKIQ